MAEKPRGSTAWSIPSMPYSPVNRRTAPSLKRSSLKASAGEFEENDFFALEPDSEQKKESPSGCETFLARLPFMESLKL